MSGVLDEFKGFLSSDLMTKGVGAVEWLAEVGKYFGLSPALANTAYALETVQKAFSGKLTAEQAIGRLAGSGINGITTTMMEGFGIPAPIAAALGDTISHFATSFIKNHTPDSLVAGVNHLIGPATEANSGPTAPWGGKPGTNGPLLHGV